MSLVINSIFLVRLFYEVLVLVMVLVHLHIHDVVEANIVDYHRYFVQNMVVANCNTAVGDNMGIVVEENNTVVVEENNTVVVEDSNTVVVDSTIVVAVAGINH